MRKILSLFLLLISIASYGQDFGISAGINSFNLREHFIPTPRSCCKTSTSDFLNYQNVFGVNFGGFANFRLNDLLSILGELQYSQKGFQADGVKNPFLEFQTEYYARKLTLNYLELPIMLKATIGKQKKWSPYALGGIYFSYLLSGRHQLYDAPPNVRVNSVDELMDNFDWGIRAGLGVTYLRFSMDVNFVAGIYNATGPFPFGARKKNVGWNATLRYWINVRK
ncbi:PorT family protein [Flavobacteriaceae bacterium TP-CH-4]|uniref:PorT family protein n=1 Tax=Pelagihabitans pacificus TaxID=2696054 RepID=A0A967E6E7_9FLAO|nr:porin family protein [Pelagihabitans pacificus]NHF59089.1 PorT family protein [Pelagihabitans pacificus]